MGGNLGTAADMAEAFSSKQPGQRHRRQFFRRSLPFRQFQIMKKLMSQMNPERLFTGKPFFPSQAAVDRKAFN